MFAHAAIEKQYGVCNAHPDLNNASRQRKGAPKGLPERLKSDLEGTSSLLAAASSKELRYVDVTAAFFRRDRVHVRQMESKSPLRPGRQQPRQRPKERQLPQMPQISLNKKTHVSASGAAMMKGDLKSELSDKFAAEGSYLYTDAFDRINDVYGSLMRMVADTSAGDDRVLAMVESKHKKTAKPLSETRLVETCTDGEGRKTRSEIHVGESIASARKRIQTLELEVASLWDAWDAAQQRVQFMTTEVMGPDAAAQVDLGSSSVRESLAREMAEFEDEFEAILKESHEDARLSEKEFGRKINNVMSGLLQQYLFDS